MTRSLLGELYGEITKWVPHASVLLVGICEFGQTPSGELAFGYSPPPATLPPACRYRGERPTQSREPSFAHDDRRRSFDTFPPVALHLRRARANSSARNDGAFAFLVKLEFLPLALQSTTSMSPKRTCFGRQQVPSDLH